MLKRLQGHLLESAKHLFLQAHLLKNTPFAQSPSSPRTIHWAIARFIVGQKAFNQNVIPTCELSSVFGLALSRFLLGILPKSTLGDANWVGSEADLRRAADLASYLVGSDEELNACLKWLWVRTEGLVSHYQQKIAVLASALLKEKTIQAKRAREIFYATQGSKEESD